MSSGKSTKIDEIKNSIDPLDVISRAVNVRVIPRRNIRCPFHDDRIPSLTVFHDGRWRCWGCGKHGDVLDFLGYLWFGDGYDVRKVIDRLTDPVIFPPVKRQPVEDPIRLSLNTDFIIRAKHRIGEAATFWSKQHISLDTLRHFQVGWTGRRYVIPHTYRGVIIAAKTRRNDELYPDDPKYLSVRGSRFIAPYNIDDALMNAQLYDELLVVEDEKSVWAAHQSGLLAVAVPANQWRTEWNSYFHLFSHVTVVADNDEVGKQSATKLALAVPYARVVVPPHGKDLFDYYVHLCQNTGSNAGHLVRSWLAK